MPRKKPTKKPPRFYKVLSPCCKASAGSLEKLEGRAGIIGIDAAGFIHHEGDTEIFWDSSTTDVEGGFTHMLCGACGREFGMKVAANKLVICKTWPPPRRKPARTRAVRKSC